MTQQAASGQKNTTGATISGAHACGVNRINCTTGPGQLHFHELSVKPDCQRLCPHLAAIEV